MKLLIQYLSEILQWAITPFKNGLTYKNVTKTDNFTINQIRDSAKLQEREWGNKMIGQINNGQWTTALGENLVHDILLMRGENPRRPKTIEKLNPDWETDEYIYEVKTSNWTVGGTAGEKVLATFIKYQKVPELYGKPLKIVCIANQEWELEYGTTKYFGEEVTEKTKQLLDMAKSWGIEYVRFSDFAKNIIEEEKNKKIEEEKNKKIEEVHVNNSSDELLPFGCI